MKKVLLDQEEFDALVRRNEELNVQTLDLYGGRTTKQSLQLYDGAWLTDEQVNRREMDALRAGCGAAALASIGFAALVCGICGLVIWLVQGGAS